MEILYRAPLTNLSNVFVYINAYGVLNMLIHHKLGSISVEMHAFNQKKGNL